MFKENIQPKLFSFEIELTKEQQEFLNKSPEKAFYELIFKSIDELDYKFLFSNKASRPNTPINVLISALILKERKGWSYNELMESTMFDMRTKVALGLATLEEKPFSRPTLFNLQNRINKHRLETGENLLEKTFDKLTDKQIKKLKIKTDIQRSDSTLMASNISKHSRIQLLIEVLLRISRILDSIDKEYLLQFAKEYSKQSSQKYVYDLKPSNFTHELTKLGNIYHKLSEHIKEKYAGTKEYRVFNRAYQEHFTIIQGEISTPKPSNELHSGMLQSPDDEDSTYNKKRGEESIGVKINATETANQENDIQLITDIDVEKNNVDDGKILEKKIDKMVDKTPELKELHTDGGYGNQGLDEKMEEHEITHVTTAIRGRKSEVEKTITQTSETEYVIICPEQEVTSVPTKKRNKAKFDLKKCENCALKERCNLTKNKGTFYFEHSDYLRNKRNQNILKIPEERRGIRPNVEATMKEFKVRAPKGKLKVRGIFKASVYAFLTGISINFGRIYRYLIKKNMDVNNISAFINNFIAKYRDFTFYVRDFRAKNIFHDFFENSAA